MSLSHVLSSVWLLLLLILARDLSQVSGFSLFQEKEHMLTNMPIENRDVLVSYYYPDLQHSRGRKIPVGEPVTVLCHFANEGETPLNITGIMGSLNKYDNFYHYVQNSTFEPIGHVLMPSEEITLTYTYKIESWINTMPRYRLSNTVFYQEQYQALEYSHTFQNSTVELYTVGPDLDRETAGMLLLAFGMSTLVIYLTYLACSPLEGGVGKRRKGILNLFNRSLQK